MDLPVEVVASLCTVGGILGAELLKIGWRWWRNRRGEGESQAKWQARVFMEGMKGSQAQQDRAVKMMERMVEEFQEQAEQCRKEYEALKQGFDEETRQVDQLRTKVDRLERKLAERDKQIEELRQTLVRDYVRQPSRPPPPPENEPDDTPVIGRARKNRR